MYNARTLPPEEWNKLEGLELGTLTPHLSKDDHDTRVIVVEDGDRIVACWAVTKFVHLEGAWIDPGHRHAAGRLLRATTEAARELGADGYAITGATTPETAHVIARLGGHLMPVEWFMVPVRESARGD